MMQQTTQHNHHNHTDQHSKKPESLGEKLFNYLTYGGVGFGINLGLSVIITDYFTHGKGNELLHSWSKKSAGTLHKISGTNIEKAENTAYAFLKTHLLMSGGHVVMVPIKLMEDSKRHIVHRINRMLGVDKPIIQNGKEVPISELAENDLPELYEDQPKQSWGRTVVRRLLAIAATMTVGTLMGKDFQHKVEDSITDKMMLPAMRAIPLKSAQNLAENDRFQRYARLVSLDQFFTVITSAVAYVTNGAKKHVHTNDEYAAPITEVNQPQKADSEARKQVINFPSTTVVEPSISSHTHTPTLSVGAV
jgi:hypothetical protein